MNHCIRLFSGKIWLIMKVASVHLLDKGQKKQANEDELLVDDENQFYIVSDGMGGETRGVLASQQTCQLIHQNFLEHRFDLKKLLDENTQESNEKLKSKVDKIVNDTSNALMAKIKADDDLKGLASTATIIFFGTHHAYIGHVGDSRAYLLRDQAIHQLTNDHTFKAVAKRNGEDEAIIHGNALTQAIGFSKHVVVDHLIIELENEDRLLLCTDGVTDLVTSEQLQSLFSSHLSEKAMEQLLSTVNQAGARDNLACIALEVDKVKSTELSATVKFNYLQHLPFFEKLRYEEVTQILEVARTKRFEMGEYIIREGEKGREFYVLLKGMVDVKKNSESLVTLKAGTYFGEMSLIDGKPRSADIQASTGVTVLQITHSSLFKLLQKNPQLGVKVLWNFNKRFSDLMRNKNNKLKDDIEQFNFVDV